MDKKEKLPVKSKDVPATVGMLNEFRSEVNSRFDSLEKKFDSRFDSLKGEMDSRFNSLRGEMDSRFDQVTSTLHSIKLLIEEQRAQNIYVLDGYTQLHESQEEIKTRLTRVEKKVGLS